MARTAANRGREVRRALLAAAVELIPEVGWNAVSTRLLAERAHAAPGLVHYHFQSLPALLRKAAVDAMRETLSAAEPVLAMTTTVDAGLDLMLASLDAYSGTDPASLLFIETYLAATRDEALRAELAGLLADFRDALAGWLAEHGHDDPQQTAAVLAAAIDGVMLHRALNPDLTSHVVSPVLRRILAPGKPVARKNRREH
ncbi:MAG: TetR/AcrR family transcriptional regulator [Pseudonocardiaceae bacterium]